jgi:group I intron endonuclease
LPCFLARHDSEQLTNFIAEKQLNPVFIYEDLSNSSVKNRVLNETRNLSGIYLILNKVTLDYYIGSASTGRFHARFSNHLFHFNGSKPVKNAVKKYGLSSFAFMVLELFPEIVNKENNKKLVDLEDFYLKSLLPNYNILTEAGSSFGYKHSEITRINMKTNYSEQRRMTIGNLNKGKIFSPDTIERMRQAALSRTKPTYSEQAIANLKKSSKAVLVYNLDYTVFGEFSSMIEASKSLGCDQKTIRRALQTPKKILRRRFFLKEIKRYYSTSTKLTDNTILPTNNLTFVKLDPNFVSGFTDGEACFHIGFSKNIRYSTGWVI